MPQSRLDRRAFAALLAATAGGMALPAAAARTGALPLIKPARLKAGDLVGLITPSGHVNTEKIARSIRNIESLGLRVQLGRYVNEQRGNYAGSVPHRLRDLHRMFADPEIKGIWCITGGSGGIGLLSEIDYALIRKNPKVFVGYSDTTALHLAIHRQTGLVTFHGPLGVSTFSDYSVRYLRAVLMEPQANTVITMAQENRERGAKESNFAARTVVAGTAQGRLTGGNLSLVSALVGTPYAAQTNGALLFLEEINEAPYRVDRMMTQLHLAHNFNRSAALMLGIFVKCEAKDGDPSLTLAQTVDDQLEGLQVPAVYGYSFGHIAQQFTLPMGVMARLDTQAQTLILLESTVL